VNTGIWISLWRIGIASLFGVVCVFLLQLGLREFEKHLKESGTSGERLKRQTTLVHAGRSIGLVLILLIVVLMVLHEIGINITPILASAGVVGLAFSLGTQTIAKDFLGGILILTENQFTIGDIITVGQLTGTVEHITLRATYLRDSAGELNLIPNGDIRTVSNLTNQWAQVVVTINLDYEADLERALQILEEAAHLVQLDNEIAPALVEHPYILGWTGFTDWAVQMQMIAKTQPGKQWSVARTLRKTALELLHKGGIRMAIPHQRIENVS
jgi:small-conductance mechanosensitive channel